MSIQRTAILIAVMLVPVSASGQCPEDVDGDGFVNVRDLLLLLGNWESTACEDILVSSMNSHQVLKFSGLNGAFLGAFIVAESGGLSSPRGIALGLGGDIFVASNHSDAVLRYDGTTGAFVSVFTIGGNLNGPEGITFGPDGHLYITDTSRVLRYHGTTGVFIDVFIADNQLSLPYDIKFAPPDRVLITDPTINEIREYSANTGEFISTLVAGGQPNFTGMFLDGDVLYVSCPGADRVRTYDAITGERLAYSTPFVANSFPYGVALGPDGKLYVSGFLNNSIQRYDGQTGEFIDNFTSSGILNGPAFFVFVSNLDCERSDINGDNDVNVSDLLALLAAWGACP